MSGGFTGVDIFFVVSGYLITGLLVREQQETGRIDSAAFYARRVRRLLPALGIVTAATLLLGVVTLLPDEQIALAKSAQASLAFAANFYFWTLGLVRFAAAAIPAIRAARVDPMVTLDGNNCAPGAMRCRVAGGAMVVPLEPPIDISANLTRGSVRGKSRRGGPESRFVRGSALGILAISSKGTQSPPSRLRRFGETSFDWPSARRARPELNLAGQPSRSSPKASEGWLGRRDSNPNNLLQRQVSYR